MSFCADRNYQKATNIALRVFTELQNAKLITDLHFTSN